MGNQRMSQREPKGAYLNQVQPAGFTVHSLREMPHGNLPFVHRNDHWSLAKESASGAALSRDSKWTGGHRPKARSSKGVLCPGSFFMTKPLTLPGIFWSQRCSSTLLYPIPPANSHSQKCLSAHSRASREAPHWGRVFHSSMKQVCLCLLFKQIKQICPTRVPFHLPYECEVGWIQARCSAQAAASLQQTSLPQNCLAHLPRGTQISCRGPRHRRSGSSPSVSFSTGRGGATITRVLVYLLSTYPYCDLDNPQILCN